jgi:hypothetical protein
VGDGSGTGFEEVVVKTKTRYYDMRAMLAQVHFNVVKHEPHPTERRSTSASCCWRKWREAIA